VCHLFSKFSKIVFKSLINSKNSSSAIAFGILNLNKSGLNYNPTVYKKLVKIGQETIGISDSYAQKRELAAIIGKYSKF